MDRQDACTFITANWERLRLEAIVQFTTRLSRMTPDEVTARFMKAGEKYGTFDVNSIPVIEELEAECLDVPAYIAIGRLQDH